MQAVDTIKDPAIAKKAGALLLTAVVLGFVAFHSFSKPHAEGSQAFFTNDEGATVFADSSGKMPPFDHGGKLAVRAIVYSSDNGKTKTIAYLERFTPDGKARVQQRISDFLSGKHGPPPVPLSGDTEVKLPGAGNPWVNTSDLIQAAKIRSANAPVDTSTSIEILPQ